MDAQNQTVLRETTIALLWHIAQQHARVDVHDSRLLEDQYMSLCALRSRSENENRPEIAALWFGLRELLIGFGRGKLYYSVIAYIVVGLVC
jgi:hypothetical protein